MNPKISILLPVYNGEVYLRQCLKSVFDQTLPSFELLVGDDGSTDGSAKILASISDQRARVFYSDRNVGLFANLNRLLREARAPFVRFLCQDDILFRNCVAAEVDYMEAHSHVAMSICSAYVIDEAGRTAGRWWVNGRPTVFEKDIGPELLLLHGCFAGNLSTVCVRREYFGLAGEFNPTFRVAGDYDMWARISSHGQIVDLQRRLLKMREHAGRLSRSPRAGVHFVREDREVRRFLLSLLSADRQRYAKRYISLRQNVLNTHYLMSCLLRGKMADSLELVRVMGPRDVLLGIAAWLATVNNRLFRPLPKLPISSGEKS